MQPRGRARSLETQGNAFARGENTMKPKPGNAGIGRHHLAIAIAVALGVASLAGCGGGSGGGMVRSSSPPPAPPPAASPPAATLVNLDGSQRMLNNGESLTDITAKSLTVEGNGLLTLAGTDSFSQGLAIKNGEVGLTGSSILNADVTVMGAGEGAVAHGKGLSTPGGPTVGHFAGN
jgi:hypothetical protein